MVSETAQAKPERVGLQGVGRPMGAFMCAAVAGAAVILAGPGALFGLAPATANIAMVLAAFLSASVLIARGLQHGYPHDRIGLANLATLSRLVILGLLAVALLEELAPNIAILTLAVLSLCLDGVDGWLARRSGLCSDFGARFDVEVDAAFALLLALYGAALGITGPYVVLLGLPYYLFSGARWLWPWLGAPLPPRFSRKAICVAQIGTLIALLVPGLPGPLLDGAVLAVVAALVWSFGRDILWLHRSRP